MANGLLLRRDIHALFDRGFITIDKDLHIEVSKRIKDYGNGREYYAYQEAGSCPTGTKSQIHTFCSGTMKMCFCRKKMKLQIEGDTRFPLVKRVYWKAWELFKQEFFIMRVQ